MTYAPEFKIGTFRVVTTGEQLHETWRYFGFREPLPAIDFRKRQVVVFVEGGVCSDRGRGRAGGPVLGAWLLDDGSVLPLFEDHSALACEDAEPRVRTGFAYALSMPRLDSPRVSRVLTGERRELRKASLPNTIQEPASSPALKRADQATLARRADGTPVWLIRHPDGSLSALGADYELAPALLPGLRAIANYSPRTGRFSAPFDEWGTHLSGNRPGLVRYSVYLRDGRLEIGEPIGPVPPGRPRLHALTSYSVEAPFSASGAFDAVPHRSVRDAARMPPGTLSVVNARIQLRSDQSAVLCAGDVSSAGDCVTVRDVHAPSGCSGVLGGQFALRSESEDSVSHVVALDLDSDYACRNGDSVRPYWPHGGALGLGLAPLSGAVSFGAFGGFASSELQLGAELTAALRIRHRRPLSRSFARAQLGNVFELGVRAHWFDEPRQHGSPAWAIGLAPSLRSDWPLSHWTTPTLLGLALPEFGVIAQQHQYKPYLAWRFPIEYRAHPARQHPYVAEERLAWFVSPEFLLAFGDAPRRFRGGIVGGFTLW
jgi:hypothetical protein